MTTNSTTAAASLNVTASSSKRMSGLVSGLDTDTLVQQLTSGTQAKIDKQSQNKQIASWQQQSYREVIKALTEFQTKYLSSATSSSSILSPSFFDSTSINNTSSFVSLSGQTSAAKNMQIYGISQLAKQASFSSTHNVSNEKITTGAVYDNFASSNVSGESITLNYGGKDYKLTVDSDLVLGSGDKSDPTAVQNNVDAIVNSLKEQISKIDDLKDVDIGFDAGNNKITLTGSSAITISDGDTELLTGLGLTKGSSDISTIKADSLYTSKNLGDTLSGSTLTFNLNGLSKNITFNASEMDSYKTADGLVGYLQNKLDSAYGTGNVIVNSDDGKISFEAKDSNSVLTLTSSDKSGILGMNGALRVYAGESNRINANKTLADLSVNLSTALTGASADGSYKININGKDFTFKSTDTINTIMTTVNNDSDANVTMTYSSTTNTFSVIAKNGGSASKIEISDADITDPDGTIHHGNLAAALFGTQIKQIDTTKSISNISGSTTPNLETPDVDGNYVISINGKNLTFSKADSVDSIIATINSDPEANVTVAYNKNTNSFNITPDADGVDTTISDVTGNLATLFNKSPDVGDYIVSTGQDAKMTISLDGGISTQEITRSDNSFTLDGVNFQLLQKTDSTITASNPIKFAVQNNTDDLIKKIKDFVTDYNNIITLVNGKVNEKKPTDATYAPLTDAQRKEMSESQITNWETQAKKGILQNDSLLSSLSLDMRLSMTNQVDSIKSALYQIGIASTKYEDNGVLTVDEDKLKDAITNNPDTVQALFTGPDGIATKLQAVIKKNANTSLVDTGVLVQKAGSDSDTSTVDNSTLAKAMQDNDKQITDLKTLLETQQEQYYNKFTKLEQYLSQMNSQMSWFSSNSSSDS